MEGRKRRKSAPAPAGELALIERIRRRAAKSRNVVGLRLGIGDDCAILQPPAGDEVLVTTDFSLEGRHFRRDWHSPESVGHRVLARGLSDLAAMGAVPLGAFLSLALPRSMAADVPWIDRFLDGLLSLADSARVPLAGGDTSESPSYHILADIVLLGSAPRGTALQRRGAKPGDFLYCTGTLGGAAAELEATAAASIRKRRVRRIPRDAAAHPHLFPSPRLATGEALRRAKLATACMDLSDGLSTDLAHLCSASGVRAEVEAASLPLHSLARKLGPDAALSAALHGGEDYELLFTARASTRVPRSVRGVPVTRIGRILPLQRGRVPQIALLAGDGSRSPLLPCGWEHLK